MSLRRREARDNDAHPPLGVTALWPGVAAITFSFGALIALDQFVWHIAVLTTFRGQAPLSPLYAFWMPDVRPLGVVFVALALAALALVPRLLGPRTSDASFGAALLIGALALPLALFVVRDDPGALGSQFLIYPGEEYFDDARRIVNLAGFIRHYTDLAPDLSLHGRVHPPGFAALLFLVGRMAGPTPLAAGLSVVLVFAAGVVLAWRAFAGMVPRRDARIAALLVLAVPSLLDFACTSMDAVFFTAACLVLFAASAALSETGRWWHATLTGVTGFVAALCSFSAAPVGLFVVVFGVMAWWRRRGSHIPVQLVVAFASFLVTYAVFRLATGFDLWESFEVARQQHYQIMASVIGQRVGAVYAPATFGNVAALAIGTGLAVVSPLVRGLVPALPTGDRRPIAAAVIVTLAVLCAGGVYTMETERIFLFAMPWLAVAGVSVADLSDGAVQFLLGVGWLQALVMEALLFTLW